MSYFTAGLISTDIFGTLTSETTEVEYISNERIVGIILENYFSGKEQCTEKNLLEYYSFFLMFCYCNYILSKADLGPIQLLLSLSNVLQLKQQITVIVSEV